MSRHETEKSKKHTVLSLIPILFFLAFLFFMMIRNAAAEEVRGAVAETTASAESLGSLSDSFEDVLQGNIQYKNAFINLNGLTARVLGIHTLNGSQKLANGYLVRDESAKDTAEASERVIALDRFLSERGIDFFYLLTPSKQAFYDAEFCPGYGCDAWKTIDSMVDELEEGGVSTLDMDAWYEENGWKMEDVFFVTDHHWTPRAGLAAAQRTMEILEQKGIADYGKEYLEEDSYEITVLENWFLGSYGKRVGIYYAGIDDISVYLPRFATDYTFAGLKRDTTNWYYRDTPLDMKVLTYIDYFGSDPHCIYLYADNPLQIVTNTDAVNDKRLLVVGDSFRRIWQYFLTTQFQEIYSIDLRSYTDGTLVQYIEEIRPDLVIMCANSYYIGGEMYEFGLGEYLEALDSTPEEGGDVQIPGDVSLEARETDNNYFSMIGENLKPGQTYTLTVDSTSCSGGAGRFEQMTLQDLSTGEAVCNRYFDADSDETQRWIFTVPEGTDTYAVYLYAGTKGHTAGVSAEAAGMTLREGVYEG